MLWIDTFSNLEMTGQVFLVEGMVVDLNLGESSKIVRHQHHRDVDVLQLPEMFFVSLYTTCKNGAKMVHNWEKDGVKLVQNWCKIGI